MNYPFTGYPDLRYNNMPMNQYAQVQPHMEIVKVNGENGARAFNIGPNSSALLLDTSAPLVWLIQSDGAGYKTVTPYTIAPYQQEEPASTQSLKALEMRIKKLEDMWNGESNNDAT